MIMQHHNSIPSYKLFVIFFLVCIRPCLIECFILKIKFCHVPQQFYCSEPQFTVVCVESRKHLVIDWRHAPCTNRHKRFDDKKFSVIPPTMVKFANLWRLPLNSIELMLCTKKFPVEKWKYSLTSIFYPLYTFKNRKCTYLGAWIEKSDIFWPESCVSNTSKTRKV